MKKLSDEDLKELAMHQPPSQVSTMASVRGSGGDLDGSEGWLVGDGGELSVQITKDGEPRLVHFADFDIRATGVSEDDDAARTYCVQLMRKRQKDIIETLLPASTLVNKDRMAAWLGEFGLTVAPSGNMNWTTRIQRRLESQDPQPFRVVPHLGWDDRAGGFVTYEGIITANGLQPFGPHRPSNDKAVRARAPFRYGFEDGAIDRLREVLGFHHHHTAAVIGAWVIAGILKPQIEERAELFPYLAIEAPSGSGKTTGMIPNLLRLLGNTNRKPQMQATGASFRNACGAHRSGIVWADDNDTIEPIVPILRRGTSGGREMKMAEDHHGQVDTPLVAPMMASSESMPLHHKKALADRAVLIHPPEIKSRPSMVDPSRMQWLDVKEWERRYPDPSVFAGSLVREVLERAGHVSELDTLTPQGMGRFGAKIGIMRLGALILTDITKLLWIIPEVEEWAAYQIDTGNEGNLTRELIPLALRITGGQANPLPSKDRWPMTPVLIRGEEVLVSVPLLAAWVYAYRGGRVDEQTETLEALTAQAKTMGDALRGGVNVRPVGGGQTQYYRTCSMDLSGKLIGRIDSAGEGGSSLSTERFEPRLQAPFGSTLPDQEIR